MKNTKTIIGLAVLLGLSGAIVAVGASDETEAFMKEIIKDARTDSQRSALLMEAVSLAGDNNELKVALLEKSVFYGLRGLKTAEECEKFQVVLADLIKADPERKSQWLAQQAAVYRRQIAMSKSSSDKRKLAHSAVTSLSTAASTSAGAGQWRDATKLYNEAKLISVIHKLPTLGKMMGYMRTATYMYKAQDRISDCEAKLKKSPGDLSSRSSLIKIHVTTMDNPGQALKYVNEDVDEMYRMFVPMAAKSISTLDEASCKALGDWYYKELSKSVIGIVKSRMLSRANLYYKRALLLHDKSDVKSAALKMTLSRIKSSRDKIGNVDPLLCTYCSATGVMPCQSCLTNGIATGLKRCAYCRGSGRGKCVTCKGVWGVRCYKCLGRGKVVSGSESRGAMVYKTYSRCYTCGGKGVTHRSSTSSYAQPGPCSTCSKQPQSRRGTSTCTYCQGKGGAGTCPTCSGKKTAACTFCPAG